MKKPLMLALIIILVSSLSLQAHASLQTLGTDSLGNRLIYDSDFDLTWYDYTRSNNTWLNQMNWVDGLSVNFGSSTYTDWRLPTTVDGERVVGNDGTTTAGYEIVTSEMGHLYYTELGNKKYPDPGWGLVNTGEFAHLIAAGYWSDKEYAAAADNAWYFYTGDGFQDITWKGLTARAIAVRSGRAVAPEPISSILFVAGGATFGFRKIRKRRK